MKKLMPERIASAGEAKLTSDLIELFAQIDFNGDGGCEWLVSALIDIT